MTYRRPLGSSHWHWQEKCPRWPGLHFEEREATPLDSSAFCLECLELTEAEAPGKRALGG
jgi:hypothetical protein